MQGLPVPDPEIKAATTKGVRAQLTAVVEDAKTITTKPIFEVLQPRSPSSMSSIVSDMLDGDKQHAITKLSSMDAGSHVYKTAKHIG